MFVRIKKIVYNCENVENCENLENIKRSINRKVLEYINFFIY